MSYHSKVDIFFGGYRFICEIVHNIQNGIILLAVRFELNSLDDYRIVPSQNPSVIIGKLTNGTVVNLYNNRLIKNHTQNFQYQELLYSIKNMIWSYKEFTTPQFNELICEVENGLNWSNLTGIDTQELTSILIKSNAPKIVFWYNVKITFSTIIKNELLKWPRDEACEVIERLRISIESDEKRDVAFFIENKR